MIEIETCTDELKSAMAARFDEADGFIELPLAALPTGFTPQRTQFVFMQDDDGVRVFIPADVAYDARASTWREVMSADPVPGGYRCVLEQAPDFDSAFESLRRLLLDGSATTPSHKPRTRRAAELTDLDAVAERQARKRVIDAEALEIELGRHIVGQDDAIGQYSRALRTQLGKTAPERPLTLCLVGPSGVGKTATAEATPESLRALDGELPAFAYTAFNMSECQSEADTTRLLGAAPGYVGYSDGGALAKALTANPTHLILLDEIDKAHNSIATSLMGAIDRGRLGVQGQANGRHEVDTSHAVFVLTSNKAAVAILDEIATSGATDAHQINEICRGQLRAAGVSDWIIGRITAFIVYRPLSAASKAQVATLTVQRLAKEYDVELTAIDPEIIGEILERAGADDFGVRPLAGVAAELLGQCLVDAIAERDPGPCRLDGVPPRCIPEDIETAADTHPLETADAHDSSVLSP